MKLIFAIVSDDDGNSVMGALNKAGFIGTKLCSTGGFLKAGNTTILVGTDDEKIEAALEIIKEKCRGRSKVISNSDIPSGIGGVNISFPTEVDVGGATIFVLNIERFEKL